MTDTVIFLTTTGAQTWQAPRDWNNAAFKIEAIGGGASGSVRNDGTGVGGDSGTYTSIVPSDGFTLIPYQVINANVSAGAGVGDTWISNTGVAPTTVAQGTLAKPGQHTTTGCIGSTKIAGGAGGTGVGVNGVGGGAGAAGPGGVGGNGATDIHANAGGGGAGTTNPGGNASDVTQGAGGSVGGGAGGAGRSSSGNGAVGSNGSGTWTSNPGAVAIGPGGGGGGGVTNGNSGGNGGNYGGGGGGLFASSGTPGAGAQGIIIITYTPATTPPLGWKRFALLLRRGLKPRKKSVMHGAYTMQKRRHITPYHAIPVTTWTVNGGGSVLKRNSQPTLAKLRVTDPTLED